MIDKKDLMLAVFSELIAGYTFYKKESNGTFARCIIHPEEIKDPKTRQFYLDETKRLIKEKKLFRRINDPGKSFVK